MLILRLIFFQIIIIMIFIKTNYSLKCRTEDAPSDGELKRVARSCMRKFGDVAFTQNFQQQQRQQSQGKYRQKVTNRENHGYNYEDSEESDNDDFDDDQYYNKNNNRNHNRQQHGYNNNNNERDGDHNDDRQRNRNRYNSNNKTSNGNGNNNRNYSNPRNPLSNTANNRGNNNNNNNNNIRNNNNNNNYNNNNPNNSYSDVACIVHCFFAEMHMLNNDDYPDRHKMSYILTKDIRDRDLRNFYTDTIQECFRYLENHRRREKCQYSRDLITCMTEYAKGNCDDWNEFNMMFN